MADHDQGRPLPLGRAEQRVRGRVDMSERRSVALGRELELPRDREHCRIHLDARALLQHVDGSGGEVDQHDLLREIRPPGDEGDVRTLGDQTRVAHGGVREVEVDELTGRGVEQRGVLHPPAAVVTGDPAVGEEGVRRPPEDPVRPPELGGARADVLPRVRALPLQVPPAAAIADPIQLAGRAPGRLPDRLLAVATSHRPRLAERAVGRKLRFEQLAAVPRHPRQIPRQPAHPRAVGRDPGIGVEVPSRRDNPWLR